jgi:O-antigen/teichoic acid export membrane protein
VTTPGEEPEDLTRTVVRGVGLAGSGFVLAQVLNLGFYVALARLATPEDFGILAAASVLLGSAMLITESGMVAALIHRRDRVEEATHTAIAATIGGGFLFSLIALAVAPLLGLFFQSDEVTAVAAALSGTVLLKSAAVVPAAILQRRFSFLRRLVIEPLSVVAFGVAAVIATANGMGVWGLVIGQYAYASAEFIFSWALAPIWPRIRLMSFSLWRELAGYGRHVLAATMILRLGDQADTGIVGRFLSTAALGQYRYAIRLASTPYMMLLAAASYVLFPAFARISDNRERFERAFMSSLRWTCFAAFPVGLLILPLGEPLAVVLFGETWRQAGHAAMAMCLYPCASILSSVASEALKAAGKPQRLTRMHTVTTVSTIALMLAGLPLGLEGVAGGLSAGAVVGAVYGLRQVETHIGFTTRPMWERIWPPAAAGIAMAGLVLLGEQLLNAGHNSTVTDAFLIVGGGIAGAAIYLAVLAVLAPETISDARAAVSNLRKRRRDGKSESGGVPPPAVPEGRG